MEAKRQPKDLSAEELKSAITELDRVIEGTHPDGNARDDLVEIREGLNEELTRKLEQAADEPPDIVVQMKTATMASRPLGLK